jgi:HSP20 family protein
LRSSKYCFSLFLPAHWQPAVEVFEEGERLWVLVEAPGLVRETVEVVFNRNELLIRGERRRPVDGPVRFYRKEIPFGPFEVQVSLPVPVEPDGIEALYHNGLLLVSLPRASSPRLVKIQVQGGEEAS